jgi:hypothetical protein
MILQRKGVRILWGLLVLTGMLAGTQDAGASGIVIKASGGAVSGSDPMFYYQFDVALSPGFQWFSNDYFQLESLPGVTPPNPPLGQLGNNPALPSPGSASGYIGPDTFGSPVITVTDTSAPFASNVEWLNTTGATITAGASGLSLGSFFVYTSVPLSSLPPTVTYIALSHDPNGNPYFQGPGGNAPPVTIILASVPEPSSIVLLLSGASLLSLFLAPRRRR